MHKKPKLHQFSKVVHTPNDLAVLVASGCGCEDSLVAAADSSYTIPHPDAPLSEATWSGVLTVEGEMTGDGRYIENNALRWENLPLPLRYSPADNGGHQGAVVVGRIMTAQREADGRITATGDFDLEAPYGVEAARLAAKSAYGVSVDMDDVSFEVRVKEQLLDDMDEEFEAMMDGEAPERPAADANGYITVYKADSGDEMFAMTESRIRAATMVDIPAFAGAAITLDNPDLELVEPSELTLVASGMQAPPTEWFTNPDLPGPTALTVTDDGRVYGHLAVWGTCHTAYTGQCVEPPHSPSSYAYFRTGAVLTADGNEVATGSITLDTLHAGRNLSAVDTISHYEHTGRAVADVSVGEDVYGIWVAGYVRPGVNDEKISALRASPLSGDWRRIGGNLELVAALAVNSPGFPVPRTQGLVASGQMYALVASGVVEPGVQSGVLEVLDPEDLKELRALAAERRAARSRKADELAASTRKLRAAALAGKVSI